VLLDLYGTNHHAFASPDQFDPERDISWQDQGYDFVPQGAGDPRHDHRCPGERMTLALMVASIRWLAGKMSYEIPLQDLTVRLNRLPALPESGFMLANIKVH
jgi:fatty-acid peroxygenase